MSSDPHIISRWVVFSDYSLRRVVSGRVCDQGVLETCRACLNVQRGCKPSLTRPVHSFIRLCDPSDIHGGLWLTPDHCTQRECPHLNEGPAKKDHPLNQFCHPLTPHSSQQQCNTYYTFIMPPAPPSMSSLSALVAVSGTLKTHKELLCNDQTHPLAPCNKCDIQMNPAAALK